MGKRVAQEVERGGWLVTGGLLVPSPAPPELSVEVSQSETPKPLLLRAGLSVCIGG